jgi:hypothetical protein
LDQMAKTVAELLRDGYRCNRNGPLWKEFLRFHYENPWVYSRLKELCLEMRKHGWRKYSTRTLIAVLRWERDLETGGQEVRIEGEQRKVKLNDHHTAYYARMIVEEHPFMWDFFEMRAAEGDPDETRPPPRPEIMGSPQLSLL